MRFQPEIEKLLGWKPPARDEGTVANLNELPASVISQAKRLPALLRDPFISFYVNERDRRFVREFIDNVIVDGEDPRTWRRGRILVPDFSPRALMQNGVGDIIAALRSDDDRPWHRIRPDRRLWDAREYVTGAPAVVRPELDYHFVPGSQLRDLLPGGFEVDAVDDVGIATRRWIAANIARVAKSLNIHQFTTPEALISGCYPDLQSISNDALVAARGLLHEFAVLPNDEENVPGFRGPDDWYQNG